MIEPFAKNSVRGFLHRPQRPSGHAIALTHGAGSNCQAPLLVAVAGEFAEAGFTVLRCDLPYRQARGAVVDAFERRYLARLLERSGGSARRAAREANMDRGYLMELLKRHRVRSGEK